MREMIFFRKNARKGYNVYRAAPHLVYAYIRGYISIHMVGCEGKKGCMGVGDGTKVWGDGEGARWHMVLMFLSGV